MKVQAIPATARNSSAIISALLEAHHADSIRDLVVICINHDDEASITWTEGVPLVTLVGVLELCKDTAITVAKRGDY